MYRLTRRRGSGHHRRMENRRWYRTSYLWRHRAGKRRLQSRHRNV